ncbi:arginine-glutamic acid dipeptide repeats protein-like [Eriocheir sinensis]|uniref:arginine-glutamic acid dipeptide repeats protein-like n=1 Tax=Eriocheir sinensis TaxID=95602 RepID=UPI0021C8D9F6|nr:arginine-glutamic acid dipeptide repeats protein-like [Eriocheir sinensis]
MFTIDNILARPAKRTVHPPVVSSPPPSETHLQSVLSSPHTFYTIPVQQCRSPTTTTSSITLPTTSTCKLWQNNTRLDSSPYSLPYAAPHSASNPSFASLYPSASPPVVPSSPAPSIFSQPSPLPSHWDSSEACLEAYKSTHDYGKASEISPEWIIFTSNPDEQIIEPEWIQGLPDDNANTYNTNRVPHVKIPEANYEWLRFAFTPETHALTPRSEWLRGLANTDKLPPACPGMSRPHSAHRSKIRGTQGCGIVPEPIMRCTRPPRFPSVSGDPKPDVPASIDNHCVLYHRSAYQEEHASTPYCHGQQLMLSKGSLAVPATASSHGTFLQSNAASACPSPLPSLHPAHPYHPLRSQMRTSLAVPYTVSSHGTFMQPPALDIQSNAASASPSPLPSLHPAQPYHSLRSQMRTSLALPSTVSSHGTFPQTPAHNIQPSTASAIPSPIPRPEHAQDFQPTKPQHPSGSHIRVSMPPLPSISCSAFLQHPTLARPQSPSLNTHPTPQSLYPTLDLLQGPQKPGYHPANSSHLSSIHTALFNPRSATLPPIHSAQLHHPQGLYHHPVTRFKTTEEVGFFSARDVVLRGYPESVRCEESPPAYPVTCPPGLPHTARLSTSE